ncbi:aspartyl/asparaginyl beta-hydroxylase isoform X3 [Phyllopteryx taeniolatus]|uniref:aspartyl/asparaginyl beta-hydroxylase isoform X3 n=1 Tax=Phyllopteryx taeniolatus TaxID=161469 RepID=UPI002AD2AA2C|nr:aspartyl/asparaginyl beta-hydroxylase isoform X3 [Phyllopteryx taeniolatus]
MQRHRHYGVSDAPEERAEPIVSEEARDGLRETEAKPPPSSGSKKAAGGDAGAGTGGKYSAFTWLAVLALLGVWSSVAVVYFDIVDYDSVIARAQEFRSNFSQVLQGKLRAYDADGDGDFDAEDAKVLLGLKERTSRGRGRGRGQPPEDGPAELARSQEPAEEESAYRRAAQPPEEESAEERPAASAAENSPATSEADDVDSEIQAAVPLPAFVEDDFVADDPGGDTEHLGGEDADAIDTSGVLVVEASSQETVVESAKDLTSSKLTQEEEPSAEPSAEAEPQSGPVEAQSDTAGPPAVDSAKDDVTHSKSTREQEAAKRTAADKTKDKAKKKKAKLLNKSDKSIKAELDAAEKLRKKGKAEAALRAFEALVRRHPESPRAHYGKAQAEDDLAEKQRSNDMLQKAIGSYGDAAELPDATPDLVRAALKRRAERQQFLGRMRGAVATLERLAQVFPEDVGLKNDLGVAYLLLGDNKGAKKVYEEVLAVAPGDGFAKVHYGFILKSENKIAESIPFLKEGLESGEPGTDDGRFYFHLGDALQRVGDQSAYHWYQVGHERGHFASVWQRSLYNVDGLKAQPWWTPNETGYTELVKALEKNWKTIRDEALAVMDRNTGQFVPEEENLREKGEWGQYTLWQQGKKSAASCQAAPKTCSLLERFPEATGCKRGQIKLSAMQPGTHVWPHTGPTNCRLRMHLGLVVPKRGCRIRCTDRTREWEEGKVLIFDDSFEHEVWQDAATLRLIFIVDVWHPQLTAYQRQTLSAI